MAPMQPGPRANKRSVRDALLSRLASVHAALDRHRQLVKVTFGVIVVASLMALGAVTPSRAVTVQKSTSGMPTVEAPAPSSASPSSLGPPPETVSAVAPSAAPSGMTAQGYVCINDASPEALRHLPGIGEKRAKAIVELRARLGKLRRPEDLLRVKGLGRKRLAKIRPLLRFTCDPPASPDASPPQ